MTAGSAVESAPRGSGAGSPAAAVRTTRAELAAALAAARSARSAAPGGAPRRVGTVLTMGALHAGHRSLVEHVREAVGRDGFLVVTVFVNPLQFGAGEDLDRYPRTLDADVALVGAAGADLVWAPSVSEVYPQGPPQVTVDPGPLGNELEGADRPGHFAGALTVVAKMFGLIRPDVTAFGEKDYQQLVLVRRMVADLELGLEVQAARTARDADGLALSSRNAHLSPTDRARAAVFPAALDAGVAAAPAGGAAVLQAVRASLAGAEGVRLDQVELRSPDLGAAPQDGPARLLAAVHIGGVRLIDNRAVHLGARPARAPAPAAGEG